MSQLQDGLSLSAIMASGDSLINGISSVTKDGGRQGLRGSPH